MKTLLVTQSRRLIFAAFFILLAFIISSNGQSDPVWTTKMLGLATFITAGSVLSAIVVILVFPGSRHSIEIVSVGVFLMILAKVSGIFPNLVGDSIDLIGFTILFVGFALLHQAFYGRWWRKTGIRLAYNGKSKFTTAVPPQEVWRQLVPNPNAPQDYYTGTLREFSAQEAPDNYRLRFRLGGSAFSDTIAHITENTEFQSFAYDITGDTSKANLDLNSGSSGVKITARDDGGSDVVMTESILATTVDHALAYWFDNYGQQVRFSAKSVLEGRRDRTMLGRWSRLVLKES